MRVDGRAAPRTGRAMVRFDPPTKPTLVVGPDGDEVVPGSGEVGQVLAGGRLPLGYHNDPDRTAATFVERDGERWLVTGDMATVGADGAIELLGRGSAPSTPAARRCSPRRSRPSSRPTRRCTTAWSSGVPDERWGSAVTAVVAAGGRASGRRSSDLAAHCQGHARRLQGAEAPRGGRRRGAVAVGQGRLPLGPGRGRRRPSVTPRSSRRATRPSGAPGTAPRSPAAATPRTASSSWSVAGRPRRHHQAAAGRGPAATRQPGGHGHALVGQRCGRARALAVLDADGRRRRGSGPAPTCPAARAARGAAERAEGAAGRGRLVDVEAGRQVDPPGPGRGHLRPCGGSPRRGGPRRTR